MRKKRLKSEEIKYPYKRKKQKKTYRSQESGQRNKACQSLCISTRESPLEIPFAEHHVEAKMVILSQMLYKDEVPLKILPFLSAKVTIE